MYQQQERVRQLAENRKHHDVLAYEDQNKEDAEQVEEFQNSTSEGDSTAGTVLSQQYGPTRWLKKDEMSLKLAAKLSDQQVIVL